MPDLSRWREIFQNPFARRPRVVSASDILARQLPSPASATPGTLIGTPSAGGPPTVIAPPVDLEHGVSGTQVFGGVLESDEYNPDLKGYKGLCKFDEMRRSDAQVRASLQVVKLPLLAARWQAVPPEGGDAVDQAIADHINEYLVDDDALKDPWPMVLRHILLQLDFGFSVLESVWFVDTDGTWRLRRLAPRLPKTVRYWHLRRDGSIVRIWQYAAATDDTAPLPNTMSVPIPPRVSFRYLPIPGEVANVFTFDREGDNYTGTSVLRAAYRNWFYKDLYYHLDGMRIDRFGVGIPVAELAEDHGLSDDDITTLEEVLQSVRANERAYLISPPGVRYRIMGPEARGGAAADSVPMVDHHDSQIARNVLASFLTAGRDSKGLGSGSQTNRLADIFVSALQGMANTIAGDMKTQIIRPLCDLNFDMTKREYPSIIVRDLESSDIERMAKVLFDGVAKSVLTADDNIENVIRRMLRLPPLEDELSRKAQREAADEETETTRKDELQLEGLDDTPESRVELQRRKREREQLLLEAAGKAAGKGGKAGQLPPADPLEPNDG